MRDVELAIAATLYFSFCGFLVFPLFGAPRLFAKMAITLCGYELVIALAWAASREDCEPDHCSRVVGGLASLAGVEIPALTGLLFLIAVGYSVFVARTWYQFPDADPGHGRPRQGGCGDGPRTDRGRSRGHRLRSRAARVRGR